MPSEGETLCKCTGATLIPLYTQGGIAKADMKIWQNDEFWATLESQQKEDRLVVVWLDSASKRMKNEGTERLDSDDDSIVVTYKDGRKLKLLEDKYGWKNSTENDARACEYERLLRRIHC